MPKVSVIVPVYNVEEYLPKCLDSIINQTLEDIEIILVDDGSPDNCFRICDEYAEKDSRVKVIHQKNSGPSVARNTGIKNATGEYVGFVDADDYIDCYMYEKLVDVCDKNNYDAVFSNYYKVNKNDISVNQYKNSLEMLLSYKDIVSGKLVFIWKNIYRRNFLLENDILFNKDVSIGEDTTFNLNCVLCSNKIYYINIPFYYYVQRESSIMGKGYHNNLCVKLENQYKEKLRLYKKYDIKDFEEDLYSNNMVHTLVMLLSNELGHKCGIWEKIRNYKVMRNTSLVKDTFNKISPFAIKSSIKFLVFLLKYRLYFILALFTK